MLRIAAASLLLAALLTGCGDGDETTAPEPKGDPAEWRAAVEARTGRAFTDAAWETYRSGVEESCEDHEADGDWSWLVAMRTDGGLPARYLEEDVSYACPGQLKAVRKSIARVQDAVQESAEICALAPSLRTARQQRLAEATGC